VFVQLAIVLISESLAKAAPEFRSIDEFHRELGYAMYSPVDLVPLSIRVILGECEKVEVFEVVDWSGDLPENFGYTVRELGSLPVSIVSQMTDSSILGPSAIGLSKARLVLRCSGNAGTVEVLLSEGEDFWRIRLRNCSTDEGSASWTVSPNFVQICRDVRNGQLGD